MLAAHPIVHVNAALNTLATVLLVIGYVLIRRRNEVAHRNAMVAALVVSAAFLGCYLYYHFAINLTVKFTHPGPVRYFYYALLASHVLLAMTVPFLALWAAWLGTRALAQPRAAGSVSGEAGAATPSTDFRQRHRRVVRWAFPIWLYVSVTGVLVYFMLYWWFPPT
ncbi:DUF420 domain-containing protein [Botrimarina sp.]|uniref:DUF420 domain-containing protein n=1 Tax=Botrimarina sp. TaxID=2795802 RepID=UPI0032EE2B75